MQCVGAIGQVSFARVLAEGWQGFARAKCAEGSRGSAHEVQLGDRNGQVYHDSREAPFERRPAPVRWGASQFPAAPG